MRQAVLALTVLTSSLLLGGCSSDPYARFNLGPAHDVVPASIDALGGLQAWQNAGKVHATAVVSFYQADGQADVNRLSVTFDYGAGVVEAQGQSPEGSWKATASRDGRYSIQGAPPKGDLKQELLLLLTRSAGPLNFVTTRTQVKAVAPTSVEGVAVVRVGVQDPNGQAVAYYFDAATNMLRFVTSGADAPGGEGTITVYPPRESYVMLPNALAFPKSFRVNQIGQNVLLSDRPVLEVEFSKVTVE
jgi:hypothetical protein